ncbi:WD40 repeat [Lentzea waywayandensis]|uniref:WD40 repeat n=1 Tax=Lentzea waywayandensis TaxID=84724 RepID=A0A1I6EX17_9PSEU|nr:caspase family protein [Lentzea waywayandensis]SFR22214.1 WD40 repeat [Lentzea waywayandensis]
MSSSPALGLPGVRVVLAGTGTHVSGSRLTDVPEVRRSAEELERVLVRRCGLDPANLRTVLDPATPRELGDAITAAANEAESVLLIYYVGHGLVGSTDSELYLATSGTDDLVEGLAYKALPYSAVREALRRCRARSTVVVLDCCFSGRASGAYGTAAADGFTASAVRGTHVLAAAAHDETALVLPGEECTAFTGRLVRLLTEGEPTRGQWLTLSDVYDHLDRVLAAEGLPKPRQHASDTSGRLVLAPNAAVPQVEEAPVEPPADGPCPYRGMNQYDAHDARFFFGREDAIGELLTRLNERRTGPFVVVGPSGSGKSSLLRAGLLPAIESGALPGWENAPTRVFTPREKPLENLRAHLAPGAVVVVDQFEEVFAVPDEEREFVEALCAAQDSLVIIGVRADFYGRCMAHPELVPALRDNTGLVVAMTGAELRDVIEKPAEAAGLALEPGLADLVLQDLRAGRTEFDATGVLPLLSYALLATWQRRRGSTLTLAGYQAGGGIWESVSQRAERTYEALGPDLRKTARRTLLRMVRIGVGAEHTRRRTPLGDLSADARGVLDVFARDRLVTVDADSATITHESLLRAWPRLALWIERDGADLVLHQQIADAAHQWAGLDRDTGSLLRGRTLTEAELWRERGNDGGLTPLEREFLDGGTAQRRAQEEEAERQRAAERRQNRRLRVLTAGLAVLVLVASVTTVFALRQQQAAQEQQRTANARLLVSQAEAARGKDPYLALQLGIAAERIHSDSQTRASLVSTLAGTAYRGTLTGATNNVDEVTFSADSKTLATASRMQRKEGETSYDDAVITLWDMTSAPPRRLDRPLVFPKNSSRVVGFAPVGDVLVAPEGEDEDKLSLWDLRDPRDPKQRGVIELQERQDAQALAFAPDGRTLVVATRQSVAFWDISDPSAPRSLATFAAENMDSVAYSQDGRLAAAGSDEGVVLWDVSDPARPSQLGQPIAGRAPVAFGEGGKLLATHLKDANSKNQNAFVLWDVTAGEPRRVGTPLSGNNSAMTFVPNAHLAAVAGYDGTVTLWDIADPAQPTKKGSPFSGHTDYALSIAVAPDGRRLVTGSADKTAIVWDLTNLGQPVRRDTVVPAADSLEYRADGHALASSSEQGGVRLWDLADPGRPVRQDELAKGSATTLSPDGKLLAMRDGDEVLLWDVSDIAHPKRRGVPLTGAGRPGRFSPDGRMLITGDKDKSVLWDLSDPEHPVQRVYGKDMPAIIVLISAFTADSKLFAVGNIYDFEGKVTLWDISDPTRPVKQEAPVLAGDAVDVTALAFTPDGRHLATGRSDGTIVLWNVTDRAKPTRVGQPLAGPGDPTGNTSSIALSTALVLGMEFSGNGRILASTNRSRALILWDTTDLATTHDLGPPVTTSDTVMDMRFAPDGRTLTTLDLKGAVTPWDLAGVADLQDNAVRQACGITGTGLDEEAWARVVSGLPYQATC